MCQFDVWTSNADITDGQLRRDFHNLLACKVDENPGLALAGSKVIRHLFIHHIIKTKTKTGLSFYDAMHDETRREKYIEITQRYGRDAYQAFSLWNGCINTFRPTAAKWLYKRYNANVGVLDFSAGWGGRMLGAFASGVPYIGIDTNLELIDPYHRIAVDYNPLDVPWRMIWGKAEDADFSTLKYDMVMTSPPYYNLETYQHMPEYTSVDDFHTRFLVPVVVKAFRYLRVGGHMALNMPESMYNAVKDSLPPLLEIVPYMKRNRNAGLKTNIKSTDTSERIYVWKKTVNIPSASNMVEIHESPVHGMGVFAKVDIPDKTYLAPFHGVEMSNTDFAAKYGNDTNRTYALIRQHKMIDGKDVDNLSHYCNESNTPNVALRKRGLYTIRPITAGEELFLKYHKNYLRDYTL
jgi:hypothetical protein